MKELIAALAGCSVGALAACSTSADTPARARGPDPFAAALFETAATAAVTGRGIRVCRTMAVGIAERDWVRGIVEGASGRQIEVRIVDAGRFPHVLNGVAVTAGALVRDTPSLWTPCL